VRPAVEAPGGGTRSNVAQGFLADSASIGSGHREHAWGRRGDGGVGENGRKRILARSGSRFVFVGGAKIRSRGGDERRQRTYTALDTSSGILFVTLVLSTYPLLLSAPSPTSSVVLSIVSAMTDDDFIWQPRTMGKRHRWGGMIADAEGYVRLSAARLVAAGRGGGGW
jgi:hypothetical protein